MSDVNTMKKLSEQFDALAELITAISGTFRAAGGDSAGGAVDGKAEKPVRAKAAKPAAKEEPAALTEDTLREALKNLAATKGKDKMAEALAEVGAGRLPEVDEDDYPALMDAINKLASAEEDAPKPKAKATKAKKPAAPTYDEVEEQFKELVAADKDAARKVLKEAGLKKLSEVDQEDEGALTDLQTAIKEALDEASTDEDDDDMV